MADIQVVMIDDDEAFGRVLARRLAHQGWPTEHFTTPEQALQSCATIAVTHIILDLNLAGSSGLQYLAQLQKQWPQARIVVLTGYASIATTVHAIKNGAADYLTKPVEMNLLIKTLAGDHQPPQLCDEPVSVDALEWELIQRTLQEHDNNISATARALKMHRRTLQRKLQKRRS